MNKDSILALDTVADSISVALIHNQTVLAHQYKKMERGQGEALIPMIQNVLDEAKYSIQKLTKVAVSVGPGSFTGVRIGLATARGIGLALSVPVIGVSSFEAAAFGTTEKVLVVLDTKRGDFFTQTFLNQQPIENPVIRSEQEIIKLNPPAVIGSGVSCLTTEQISILQPLYEPAVAVGLCSLKQERPAVPLYLRDADVSI